MTKGHTVCCCVKASDSLGLCSLSVYEESPYFFLNYFYSLYIKLQGLLPPFFPVLLLQTLPPLSPPLLLREVGAALGHLVPWG